MTITNRSPAVLLGLAVASLLSVASVSANTVLFSENFDAENGGNGQTNYAAFNRFAVDEGSVDLIGNGLADFFPGNGLYVDLDGTSNAAGTLRSTIPIALEAGLSYRLQFDLGNSDQRFGGGSTDNSMSVMLGMAFSENFMRQGLSPFQTITRQFTAQFDENAALEFDHNGGDNLGMLIDNVSLVVVPVPAVFLMFALGAFGLVRIPRSQPAARIAN